MLRALPIALASASSLMLPHSASAQAITQGAFRMGADALWSQGFLGGGDRIAVVDEGFGGLDESIAAGELPPRDRMRTMSFDAAHGLGGRSLLTTDPTPHGTRMAEIIHDLAPQAELVLVNYNTVDEFVRATEWVADQGIPVASHSNSFLDGPFDGTGAAARAVDGASDRGVLWINSAGNFAERHWAGGADATATPSGASALPRAGPICTCRGAIRARGRRSPSSCATRPGRGSRSPPPLPRDRCRSGSGPSRWATGSIG
ncbi:MAG: hypothetical protein H6531_01065 [Actinobacteria bacterium]|nr:hypothetical protein [Actinomycetota bacterium]